MTRRRIALACLLLGLSAAPFAADVVVNVITEAQIAPGVYGRVEIGKGSPPPVVVYPEPRIITTPKTTVPPPIYLHVPPGHAKHWKRHCKKYDACGQPVYFVKSAEYEPKKKKKEK
jgi:hypothetical protein